MIKPAFSVLLLEKCFCGKHRGEYNAPFTSKEYADTQGKYWPALSTLISLLLSIYPDGFSSSAL